MTRRVYFSICGPPAFDFMAFPHAEKSLISEWDPLLECGLPRRRKEQEGGGGQKNTPSTPQKATATSKSISSSFFLPLSYFLKQKRPWTCLEFFSSKNRMTTMTPQNSININNNPWLTRILSEAICAFACKNIIRS